MQTLIKDCAKDAAKGDRERGRKEEGERVEERRKQSYKFAVLAKSKGLWRKREMGIRGRFACMLL